MNNGLQFKEEKKKHHFSIANVESDFINIEFSKIYNSLKERNKKIS